MLNSMTGFGRAQQELGGRLITVELKAVNHRYFECSVRITRGFNYLEEPIKSRIGKQVRRGKVEAYVTVEQLEEAPVEVGYNALYLQGWMESLRQIGRETGLTDDLTLSHIAQNRDIFTVKKPEEDQEQVAEEVMSVVGAAVEGFIQQRRREGERLVADIETRLAGIAGFVEELDARSPQTVAEYREKLLVRMKEALGDTTIDETRLLTEAALYADKVTVAEEMTRLRTHLDNFKSLLHGAGPIGKKLDFYMQEMNREINTVGSKAGDVTMAKTVIEIKSELENIREQIQNIE